MVDAALAGLRAVGDREKRAMTPDIISRIARAAADQRSGSTTTPSPSASPTLVEVEPLVAAGRDDLAPRRPRPSSAVALVAAVLAAVVAGSALLSQAPQQVVTQEGTNVLQSPPVSGDPAVSDGAERPVLDLGDATTTMTTTTTAQTTITTPTTGAPTSAAETSVAAPEATTAVSTEPAPIRPTSTVALPIPESSTGTPPLPEDWLAVDVGIGGTVLLRFDDSRAEVGAIATTDGWSERTTLPRANAIGFEFSDGTLVASLETWSQPGWFHLGVDHGDYWPSRREWTRTTTIEGAGTVVVNYGNHGLSGLEIRLADGWQHRVDTVGPDHLLVTVTGPSPMVGRERRIDAGPVMVDLRIAGS